MLFVASNGVDTAHCISYIVIIQIQNDLRKFKKLNLSFPFFTSFFNITYVYGKSIVGKNSTYVS